jgi:tetratricopeptide (TPR) repeat protein
MGKAYKGLGKTAKAIEFYCRAIEEDPSFAVPYFHLAVLFLDRGQNVESM